MLLAHGCSMPTFSLCEDTMKQFILNSLTLALGLFHLSTGNASLSVFADADGDGVYDSIFNTTPGAVFKLSVYANEDGLHEGLTSYGINVDLDSPLKIAGASANDQLANITSASQWDLPESKSITSTIEVIDGSFFDSFSGLVHLFDMTLLAPNTPGSYNVSFKNVEPDLTFDGFVGFDGFVYDPTITFETTQIKVVPIPAALPLFASALFGLSWQLRRRTSTV
jgi:hypothetical protein